MIFKRLLKFTLTALLFTATAPAYADDAVEVILSNGKTMTWAQFVNDINNPSSLQGQVSQETTNALATAKEAYDKAVAAADVAATTVAEKQKAYNDAQNDLTLWQSQLTSANADYNKKTKQLADLREELRSLESADKVAAPWLQQVIGQVNTFKGYFDAYTSYDNADVAYENKGTVYYKYQKVGVQYKIYLSFDNSHKGETGWVEANEEGLYASVDTQNPNKLYIDLGSSYTGASDGCLEATCTRNALDIMLSVTNALTTLAADSKYQESPNKTQIETTQGKITTLDNEITELENSIATLQTNINDLTTADADGVTGLTKKYNEWQNAITDQTNKNKTVTTTKETLDRAQADYDREEETAQAGQLELYQNITLNKDVTATVAIKDYSGTILGEGHVITLGDGLSELFQVFRGNLMKVAVNGTIAQSQSTTAVYNNVATWSSNTGAFYDVRGNETTYDNLDQLGYAARANFGVNFADNKLTAISDESKVYSITVYRPSGAVPNYVQIKDSKFVTGAAQTVVQIPDNMFAKSATTDLKGKGFTNVFFEDGKCDKVVIKDRQEFYCPEDITAEVLEVERQFVAGQNAVCLPFELRADLSSEIEAICTYDKETPKRFYFKRIGEWVPANTPVLMLAHNAFSFDQLTDVVIRQTPASQMVIDEGDATDPSKCYGLLKKATRDEFQGGASESYKVYGLKDGAFHPAGENATFPAFRAVIYSDIAEPTGLMAAPRYIGILDESGADITDEFTGIGGVKADNAPSFEIAGGIGEISFTSDTDYGRVTVYTVEGKVAAMANVLAGTTTVSVPNGLYIVMGTKVLVK